MQISGDFKLATILFFAVTAGVVEEFYYRGLCRELFCQDTRNQTLYVLVSASLFAVAHWEGGTNSIAVSFLMGIFLAGSYLRIRNLWPLVAGHIAVDLYRLW